MKKKKYLLLIILVLFISNFILNKITFSENIINTLLNQSNAHIVDDNNSNIFTNFLNIFSIDFKNPVSLLTTTYADNDFEKPMYVYMNNQNIVEKPVIYIYNSHPNEYYLDDYIIDEYNLRPGVLTASYELQKILNSMGYNTIVEEANVYNYLLENDLTYNDSYEVSRMYVEKALTNYPDLELIIDIHRDAIKKDLATTTINNNDYAKIMFVMNKSYDNYLKADSFNTIVNNKYPTLSRGLYEKTYHFNQDLNENIMLLELGSNTNTYDEVLNTVDVLSILIKEYLDER